MAANPRVQIIDIKAASDGDSSHRPNGWCPVDPPHLYLEKLAIAWLRDQDIAPSPHLKYYLNRLPDGYAVFERPRPRNPRIIDKYLFGHPKHKFFDSPNRFIPHFLHLMKRGTNKDCVCTVCRVTEESAIPSLRELKDQLPVQPKPTIQPEPPAQPHTRLPPAAFRTKDEEQTPDMVRWLIDKLKQEKGTIDEPIREPMSMDWRAEHALLNQELCATAKQHAWLPRRAEIVLFVRHLEGQIRLDTNTQTYKVFNENVNQFVGYPKWEAGVIGQTPEEMQSLDNILVDTRRDEKSPVYSGFRVEPLPDPNDFVHKEWTKRYVYIPLCQMRPFNFWKEYTAGVQDSEGHVTISHALKCMSSFALTSKFRFKGSWPHATIFHRGLHIGAELVTIGDAVRVLPSASNDDDVMVMVISSIRLQLSNLDTASANDYDSGSPYRSLVEVVGRAYTLSAQNAFDAKSPCESWSLPPGMQDYGQWWLVHSEERLYSVPFNRIMGRCYESNAMKLWHPGHQNLLNIGLDGIRSGRAWATRNDNRVARRQGKTWFWADSRAELLGILSLNNVAVDVWAGRRSGDDLDEQRCAIKVLEKEASKASREKMQEERKKRRVTQVVAAGKMGASRVATQEAQDEEGFIIENLLSKRTKSGAIQYEVQWLGWEETTWEPVAMLLEDVPEMVKEYEDQNGTSDDSRLTKSGPEKQDPSSSPAEDQVETDFELAKRLQEQEHGDEDSIEKLLRKRRQPKTGFLEYEVKWQGWEETTWELATTLEADAPKFIEQFERRPKKPTMRQAKTLKAKTDRQPSADGEAESDKPEAGPSKILQGSVLAAYAHQSPNAKRKRSLGEYESNPSSKRERVHKSSGDDGDNDAPGSSNNTNNNSSSSSDNKNVGRSKEMPISLDGADDRFSLKEPQILYCDSEDLDDDYAAAATAGRDLLAGWIRKK